MVIITEQQKIALEKFAAQAVLDMKLAVRTKRISNNRQSPVTASGRLDASISYALVSYGVEIYANDYVYYLIYGRKPGRRPPFQVIRDWIDDKGIIPDAGADERSKDSMAWAVVKKMAKEGTTIYRTFGGNNSGLFDEVFSEEALQELTEELADAMFVQFESMVFDGLNTSTV